ncbi:MAG: hypothetical protein HW412_2662 [Bacteroidetes bacterium]|nr:hypothetical protein [Bacteroidota bacterium]
MKNPKSLLLLAADAALLTLAGCQSDENPMQPRVVAFSGTWSGPFTHPGYDGGTLTLALAEVRTDSISGTYTLRLSKLNQNGTTSVQNYGGSITEARRNGETGISFTLQHTQFTWDGTGSSPQDGRMSGTWRSRTSGGINGTFDATRN